jgi:hypothetical protein
MKELVRFRGLTWRRRSEFKGPISVIVKGQQGRACVLVEEVAVIDWKDAAHKGVTCSVLDQ